MAPRKGNAAVLTLLILEFGLGVLKIKEKYEKCQVVLTLLILEFGLGEIELVLLLLT